MSSATAKWFDLADLDSKLERKDGEGFGHYRLELEVPAERLLPLIDEDGESTLGRDLLDMGWMAEPVGEDRFRLTNHAPMNRKSEIVAALRPFFSEAEIDASHVSVHDLRQGEVVEGLQARQMITEAELQQDIAGVEPDDAERIAASVRRAQELIEKRMQKQTTVVFEGHGRELFDQMTAAVERVKGWSEAEAAFAVQQQLVEAIRTPNSVHAVKLTDYARALVTADSEREIERGENYALGKMASNAEDWEDLREAIRSNEWFQAVVGQFDPEVHGDLVSVKDVFRDAEISFTPEVMDRVDLPIVGDEAFARLKERLPFLVIRDSSVPTRNLVQNMAAVDKALDVVAAELELPRHTIIPNQRTVPVRFSYDAVSVADQAIGYVQRGGADEPTPVDAEEREALTMNLSVTKGRSFTHEFGHLVDLGNGLSKEERHAILSKSGVLADTQAAVDRLYPQGGPMAEYLLDESEIFARTFDAHIVNVVRERGDHSLEAIGGLHTTSGFDVAAPYGDLEKSSAFMSELKDVLAVRREARHEAQHRTAAEAGAAQGKAVSFGI